MKFISGRFEGGMLVRQRSMPFEASPMARFPVKE